MIGFIAFGIVVLGLIVFLLTLSNEGENKDREILRLKRENYKHREDLQEWEQWLHQTAASDDAEVTHSVVLAKSVLLKKKVL